MMRQEVVFEGSVTLKLNTDFSKTFLHKNTKLLYENIYEMPVP